MQKKSIQVYYGYIMHNYWLWDMRLKIIQYNGLYPRFVFLLLGPEKIGTPQFIVHELGNYL